MAQQQAVDRGCDQVVWLDAAEHRWVEEMGGMNLFFVSGGAGGQGPRIVTPPLTGTLLPGITRDSLLRLAPELGIKAVEERISVEAWRAQCASGELTEVFACGTAAVITPVGRVKGESAEWVVADGAPGPGDHAPARGADRHPVRPPPRPVRLGAQGLLTQRRSMIAASGPRRKPAPIMSPGADSSRMVRQTRQKAKPCGTLGTVTSGRIIIGWRVGT